MDREIHVDETRHDLHPASACRGSASSTPLVEAPSVADEEEAIRPHSTSMWPRFVSVFSTDFDISSELA